MLVFKNNLSLFFPHINQNFNVLLYKSFNKFPSDTKITIKDTQADTRTVIPQGHMHTQSHMLAYTQNKMRHSWFGTLDVWSSLHWSAGLVGHAVQNKNNF